MRLFNFLTLAVASAASAFPHPEHTKRDGPAVVDAVQTISSSMVELNTTVSSYNGGVLGTATALKIEFQSLALANDLRDAISTTENSANFTEAESMDVSGAFLDLQPDIFSTLENIVGKKEEFENGLLGVASLGFLVKSNLEKQMRLAGELGDAVVVKLTETYAGIAPVVNQQIADKFEKAIAAFE